MWIGLGLVQAVEVYANSLETAVGQSVRESLDVIL